MEKQIVVYISVYSVNANTCTLIPQTQRELFSPMLNCKGAYMNSNIDALSYLNPKYVIYVYIQRDVKCRSIFL